MNIKDEIVSYVADLDDPREAWVKLQKLYVNYNYARTMYLSNKLQAFILEEGKLISELFHQVKRCDQPAWEKGWMILRWCKSS